MRFGWGIYEGGSKAGKGSRRGRGLLDVDGKCSSGLDRLVSWVMCVCSHVLLFADVLARRWGGCACLCLVEHKHACYLHQSEWWLSVSDYGTD